MVLGTQRARTLSPAESPPEPAPDQGQAGAGRLERLGPALASYGMTASLVTPPGRVPSLRVVNPAAPALAEDIYAGRCADGTWGFWWSWAERIAAAGDADRAAALIARVLAAPHAG